MIVTLFYWGLLYGTFAGMGWWCRKVAQSICKQDIIGTWDAILMSGIVLSTLYAETISLFAPLGLWALLGLLVVSWISMAIWHKEMFKLFFPNKSPPGMKARRIWNGMVLLASLGFAAWWSCSDLCDFDSLNYHAQSIRWLEEHGIVKGLGNLHTRLAYNSAFFPLQALFSFTWAYGQSLHSLNGFLWVFSMCFCCFRGDKSPEETRTMPLSDVFRVLLFLVTARRGLAGPTPTPDFFPLFLTGYVFVKWCELDEQGQPRMAPRVWLGWLAVFCASVKLSGAMLACFCLQPTFVMFFRKNWKGLAGILVGCAAILAPFLTRNVLVSGWLVYPWAGLDLFDVDWKIPALATMSDAAAIRGYALLGGAWDLSCLKGGWLSCAVRWIVDMPVWELVVVAGNAVLFLGAGLFLLWRPRTARPFCGSIMVFVTLFAGFAYLILSAPSWRFGIWWLLAGPAMACRGLMAGTAGRKGPVIRKVLGRTVMAACVVYATAVAVKLCGLAWKRNESPWRNCLFPADYPDGGAEAAWMEMGGHRFYYHARWPGGPNDGGLNSYWGFPGTECRTLLERIEMRSAGLSGGFRARSDARNRGYDFQGRWLDHEEQSLLLQKP